MSDEPNLNALSLLLGNDAVAISRLLGCRFGDRSVYLQSDRDRTVLRKAIAAGLVSSDGYVTPAGYRFRRQSDK